MKGLLTRRRTRLFDLDCTGASINGPYFVIVSGVQVIYNEYATETDPREPDSYLQVSYNYILHVQAHSYAEILKLVIISLV